MTETVGKWLGERIEILGFDNDKSFEAAELIVQTGLSLLGGLAVAIGAYWLIHSNQIRAARDGRKIERARLLHDLDREYFDLMAARCLVRSMDKPKPKYSSEDLWNLEFALTKKVVWFPKVQNIGKERTYYTVNHSRFVRIHEEWLIDTLILHSVAAWARRIANAVDAGILDRRDVSEMWRNILPWARDNRFSFMTDMFGSTALERLELKGILKPKQKTPLGYVRAKWPLQGWRKLCWLVSWVPRWCGRNVVRWMDSQRTLRRLPPDIWPADITPFYAIIRTVISQSIINGQLEALDYAHLIPEALGDEEDRLDPALRATLFG